MKRTNNGWLDGQRERDKENRVGGMWAGRERLLGRRERDEELDEKEGGERFVRLEIKDF